MAEFKYERLRKNLGYERLKTMIKCQVCKMNDWTHSCEDPYASEIHNDHEISHFWCDDPRCIEVKEEELYQSAMDI